MKRIQLQLPDKLYRRAKRFSIEHKISLSEIACRGMELVLESHPHPTATDEVWKLPRVNGGGIKVPLEDLHDISADDQSAFP